MFLVSAARRMALGERAEVGMNLKFDHASTREIAGHQRVEIILALLCRQPLETIAAQSSASKRERRSAIGCRNPGWTFDYRRSVGRSHS
jgi:hypothetical protein